ncbi:hypothetical protein D5H75_38230 [Bailinhaonella thermotolerans]|uniref:Uncharacterized protein n=2 Tax=Bailinhaonella thermotolerans TaxID=1070861 RepID=A0A3A4A627_9ACTN|nr:hypothetical protein D5H75_38230 [Bailinhaonella thermotolerans]
MTSGELDWLDGANALLGSVHGIWWAREYARNAGLRRWFGRVIVPSYGPTLAALVAALLVVFWWHVLLLAWIAFGTPEDPPEDPSTR